MSTISTPKDLFDRLFVPFDDDLKATKDKSGKTITFVEWTSYIARAWEDFPKGFSTQVVSVHEIGERYTDADGEEQDDRQVVVVVRVIDNATLISHDATGAAPVSKTKAVWGGALPEAESQALRRAFAHFGLGLEMYLDEDTYWRFASPAPDEEPEDDGDDEVVPPTEAQVERMNQIISILEAQDDDYSAWVEQARDKVAEARDRKQVTGLVIRKLKQAMEEEGIEIPEEGEYPS